MQYEINAPLRRTAVDGRGECRVDRRNNAVFFPERRDFPEVDNLHHWISGRLNMNNLCVRPNRRRVLLDVVGVNKGSLDTKLRQPLRKKLCYATIDVALRHNVVARLD